MSAIERFFTPGHKILRRIETRRDAYNKPIYEWITHLTLSGKLWSLRGSERFASGKNTLFAEHKFACGINDITELDRYEDPEGNIYGIVDVAKRQRVNGTGHMELALELVR